MVNATKTMHLSSKIDKEWICDPVMHTEWQINKIFHTFQYIYHTPSLNISNCDMFA